MSVLSNFFKKMDGRRFYLWPGILSFKKTPCKVLDPGSEKPYTEWDPGQEESLKGLWKRIYEKWNALRLLRKRSQENSERVHRLRRMARSRRSLGMPVDLAALILAEEREAKRRELLMVFVVLILLGLLAGGLYVVLPQGLVAKTEASYVGFA